MNFMKPIQVTALPSLAMCYQLIMRSVQIEFDSVIADNKKVTLFPQSYNIMQDIINSMCKVLRWVQWLHDVKRLSSHKGSDRL